MSDEPAPIVVKVDLTEPLTRMVDKVSGAIGSFFQEGHAQREARAQEIRAHAKAKEEMILTQSEIATEDLRRRTARRLAEEETRDQAQMEKIACKAIGLTDPKNSKAEEIADDWIVNFFKQCRGCSDEDMQNVWARILAGEANKPGAYSRRTVNLVANLDRSDAIAFRKFCGLVWVLDYQFTPVIYDIRDIFFKEHNLYWGTLDNLEQLGLIKSSEAFIQQTDSPCIQADYFDRTLCVHIEEKLTKKPRPPEQFGMVELPTGTYLLTKAGEQLLHACEPEPIEGFFEYTKQTWEGLPQWQSGGRVYSIRAEVLE